MSQHVVIPLLADTRLTLPNLQSSKIAIAPGMGSTLAGLSGWKATGIGAAAGGLKGLLAPGTDYDENGRPHQKSRFGAMVGGAATGAAAGALAAPLIRGAAQMHAAGAFNMPGMMPGATPAPKVAALLPDLGLVKRASMLPGGLDAAENAAARGPSTLDQNNKEAAKGGKGMAKGPEDAKAEKKDHEMRVANAKKEAQGNCGATMNPAIDAKPSSKDKKDAKPGFPQLNFKKK